MAERDLFGATRFNAPGRFAGLSFTPDGQVLAALVPGPRSTELHSFRAEDGTPLAPLSLKGYWQGVIALPEGAWLIFSREAVARVDARGAVGWTLKLPERRTFTLVSASPDGALVGLCGSDSEASVYDARTGKLLTTVKEPKGEVLALGFSPDGQHLATGGDKGIVRIYERKSGRECAQRKSTKVLALAFSPDGSTLAGGHGNGDLVLWQVPSLAPVTGFRGARHRFYGENKTDLGPAGCYWLAFSPDGRSLISAGNEHQLRLWDRSGTAVCSAPIPRRHQQGTATVLSPDGSRIAVGGSDGALSVWDAAGQPVTDERSFADPVALALTPERIVLTSATAVLSWRRADGRAQERVTGGSTGVLTLPDGKLLLLEHGRIVVLPASASGSDIDPSGDELLQLDQEPSGAMALSPDGKRLAVPLPDGVEWWDLERGSHLGKALHDKQVLACGFGPDGRWLVTVSEAIRIWSLGEAPAVVRTIELVDEPSIVGGVAVSPRGWIAASLDPSINNYDSDSALVIVDPRTGSITELERPGRRLGQVAFLDEVRAVVVDSSGELHLADVEKGEWLALPGADPSKSESTSTKKGWSGIGTPQLDVLPLTVSADGTRVAYVDAARNVVLRTFPQVQHAAVAPFVVDTGGAAAKVPGAGAMAMFKERLAGARFLFAGTFKEASVPFREEIVPALGGQIVKTPKAATHLVVARKLYVKHVPSTSEKAVDALIAKGAAVVKLSEQELIALLLPTLAEARALLSGEVEDGHARWNRWRALYSKSDGGFVRLDGIDLTGADLRGAHLHTIHFDEARLGNACFAGIHLSLSSFRGADLRGADLTGSSCYRTDFGKADLREAKLDSDLSYSRFDGADLRGVDLRHAKIEGSSFTGAKLDGAKLPKR